MGPMGKWTTPNGDSTAALSNVFALPHDASSVTSILYLQPDAGTKSISQRAAHKESRHQERGERWLHGGTMILTLDWVCSTGFAWYAPQSLPELKQLPSLSCSSGPARMPESCQKSLLVPSE